MTAADLLAIAACAIGLVAALAFALQFAVTARQVRAGGFNP